MKLFLTQLAWGIPIALAIIAYAIVQLAKGREVMDSILTTPASQLDPDDETVARAGEDQVQQMLDGCNARRVDRDPVLDRIMMRARREERVRAERGMPPGHPERLCVPVGDDERAVLNALRDATWPEGTPS